ncbi:MAG: 3-hydroxyacyl-CoA dehydrogenase family protein [Bacteroidota bacterium]
MSAICILGESPLVQEYATLALANGHAVSARVNTRPSPLPKGVKKTARPMKSAVIAFELTNTSRDTKRKNIVELDKVLPACTPILSSSVTVTLAEQSGWVKHPQRLIGIGALPSLLDGQLVELVAPIANGESVLHHAQEFIRNLGKESVVVKDSVGMVMPRILCMLANEAYFAMMENVAPGSEIDTAMKLGTNYPRGPVDWADRMGIGQVFAVITSLFAAFGEDRYRPAPLLRQMSLANQRSD